MYDALAAYYDRFMSDVDYDAWINYLKDILGERVRGRDVGCGTGRFTIALKEAGYLDVYKRQVQRFRRHLFAR